MKTVSISGSPRENVGKKDAKNLRRQDLIPCIMYGGKEQISFTTEEKNFKDIIYTPEACLVKLEIAGTTYDVILQDAQYHPVNDKIIHADFLQIFAEKPVKMDIPIRIKGVSPGVLKGGKLTTKLRKLKVKGLMDALPDAIDIDISKLKIGDSFKVGQLKVAGLEFLDSTNNVVVTVKSTRTSNLGGADEEEEATEEAPAEE